MTILLIFFEFKEFKGFKDTGFVTAPKEELKMPVIKVENKNIIKANKNSLFNSLSLSIAE